MYDAFVFFSGLAAIVTALVAVLFGVGLIIAVVQWLWEDYVEPFLCDLWDIDLIRYTAITSFIVAFLVLVTSGAYHLHAGHFGALVDAASVKK